LPLSFEENQGQTAPEVRYVSHGSGYELFLTPQEAVLALRHDAPPDLSPHHRAASIRALRKARGTGQTTAIRMHLEGANPEPQITGMDLLPARINYFIGNDPKKWHTDVPSFGRVRYAGVYPGVDLVFYGNQRRLEYDFVVAPGADPKAITLKVDGARKIRINSGGDLVLNVPGGEVLLQKPVVYQQVKGERREIACSYAIGSDHRVTFAVADYERSEPLVLDPVLNYSTYLGGSGDDSGVAIAVDAAGDAFVAGQTRSTDFPPGAHGAVSPSPAANMGASFVAELNPAGTQLLYSSYLAGTTGTTSNAFEQAFGIAVDTSGKIYVTGLTFATDFPTNSTIPGFKPATSASNANGTSYIAKLDPALSGNPSLVYSSYIGGTDGTALLGGDVGQAIAVDSSNPANGIVYVAGYTDSTPGSGVQNFPVMNGFQTTLNCTNGNAFLTKIDTTKSGGASLLYSTYLGGDSGETGNSIAADGGGNAYVAGNTGSLNFPVANAFQPTKGDSNLGGDAFVTKLGPGGAVAYSTYLGGADSDTASGIAVDLAGNAFITGTTGSNNFPVLNPLQPTKGLGYDGFITKLGASGSNLVYSTYLGGNDYDLFRGIAIDQSGNAYVTGSTPSVDFPLMAGTLRTKSPLFKSSDSAKSWSNDNFGIQSDTVTALALDPNNPATIYAGTNNGPFKSSDGGRNWVAINNGLKDARITAIVIDRSAPATLYVGMDLWYGSSLTGVYKSVNGGNTWSVINIGLNYGGVLSLAIDPVTPSIIYAGLQNGLFKSTNGGTSWVHADSGLLPPVTTALAIDPSNPAIIYAACGNLYKSSDGGASWSLSQTGINGSISNVKIDPTDANAIYVTGDGAYKSNNGGTGWTQLGLTTRAGEIAIDPINSSTIYLGGPSGSGTSGVYKSSDGGAHFALFNNGLEHNYPGPLLINPLNPAEIYIGGRALPERDAFVAKINTTGTSLVYSTLLGGFKSPNDSSGEGDDGFGIAVDSTGHAYVTDISVVLSWRP